MSEAPSTGPSDVRELLAQFLAERGEGGGSDFEALCRAHPREAAELRALHARVRRVEGQIGSEDAVPELDARARERYELREQIGRGGMSRIYAAFDRVLGRTLALKLSIQAPGGESAARFLREAELTASLDHPGIVPVHDLGATAEGRPFFAMKHVRGQDLAHVYARVRAGEPGWSLARACGLLLRVAETVSFAHARGVVHRDLKPANVRVGEYGEVYVMDWGLARGEAPGAAPAAEDAGDPLRTRAGSALGTPAYMAPEQAAGELAAIGSRSDVYALGALLYELLAGAPPYLAAGQPASAADVLERLLSGPPASLAELAPEAPPRLVAIQQRAMERAPDARYASAAQFADDLRAWLEGRVVRAYESGAWAELGAWTRRNRALALTAAGLALSVLLGALVVAWQQREVAAGERAHSAVLSGLNLELEAARSTAQLEATRARLEARAAEQAFDFLSGLFTATEPDQALGRDVPARELLDRAAASLADPRTEFEPALRLRMLRQLGGWYLALGRVPEAERSFEQALAIAAPAGSGSELEQLEARAGLASTLRSRGRIAEARAAFEELLADCRRVAPGEPARSLRCERQLAEVLELADDLAAAESIYARQLDEIDPATPTGASARRDAQRGLARIRRVQGRYDEAVEILRSVLAGTEAQRGPDALASLADAMALGSALKDVGALDEAEALYRRAFDGTRAALGPEHLETWIAQHNLGDLYWRQGRNAEAEPLLREVVERVRAAYGDDHFLSLDSMSALAGVLRMQGRDADSLELIEPALQASLRVRGEDHPNTLGMRNNLATIYSDQRRFDEAIEQFEIVAERLEARFGPDYDKTLFVRQNLAEVLRKAGRSEEAVELHRAVLERAAGAGGPARTLVDRGEELLGALLLARGRAAEALPYLERHWQRLADERGAAHARALEARTAFAQALLADGRLAEAQEHAQAALAATPDADPAQAARAGLCAQVQAALDAPGARH